MTLIMQCSHNDAVSPAYSGSIAQWSSALYQKRLMCAVQLVNCGLSDVTIKALEARGITALFPIQKHVYEPAAAGRLFVPFSAPLNASFSVLFTCLLQHLLPALIMAKICCYTASTAEGLGAAH